MMQCVRKSICDSPLIAPNVSLLCFIVFVTLSLLFNYFEKIFIETKLQSHYVLETINLLIMVIPENTY